MESIGLTKCKKDTTNPEVYKQACLEVTSKHQNGTVELFQLCPYESTMLTL